MTNEETKKKAQQVTAATGEQLTGEQWLAVRKAAGRHIDPATAEVEWWYGQTMDP